MREMPFLRSRKLEITYNIPIGRTFRFWEGLREGRILATKCKTCGKLYFPPVADCGECYSSEIEWVELSGKGRIVAYTHVVVRPPSFQDFQPYTVAIAELEEGVKALAWLVGARKRDLRIGMRVKMVPKIAEDGRAFYVFTPLEAETQ